MDKFECAIILLCGGDNFYQNGWRTIARIELAIEHFKIEKNACLLISSGISGFRGNYSCPESHIYLSYIFENYKQLDRGRIFVEDLSRDTVGNVYFSLLGLRYFLEKDSKLIWISNDFHLHRIKSIVNSFKDKFNWNHRYIGAPDLSSDNLLDKLKSLEDKSLKRFLEDLKSCSCPEELIFKRHDFYSFANFKERIKCE